MKKEFGKWLMDIAKYMVTAILLSSVFERSEDVYMYYLCSIAASILLGGGLLMLKEPKVKNQKSQYQRKRR